MKKSHPRLLPALAALALLLVSAAASRAAEPPPGALVVKGITPGVKGGRLIMAMPGDVKTLNPALADDVQSTQVSSYLFESLYGYDNYEQKDVPSLAESWGYNKDTREWTFKLRPGLKWSDGQPLTSDDALFFTEVIFDEKVPSTEREYMQAEGKRFEFSAPDPLTFVVKIPVDDSFAWLSLGLIKPLPRHAYGKALKEGRFQEILGLDTKPADIVACGPFRLKEFTAGQRVVLEANPHYYRFDEAGTRLPYFDEISLIVAPDIDAMALRLQTGDTDLLEDIQIQNLTLLQDGAAKGKYNVINVGPALTNNHYWFNLKPGGTYDEGGKRIAWDPPTPGAEPPADIKAKGFRYYVDPVKRAWFENEDFRKACSMATSRQDMVKTLLFGEGKPIYGFETASNKKWNNPDIPKFPYNIKLAKETLDKAGFSDRNGDGVREDAKGNPIEFTLVTNKENKVREKVGVILKENFAKIGLKLNAQVLDFNDIITRLHDSYDYEGAILGLGSGVPPHPAMARNIWLSSARMHNWNPAQKTPETPWEAEIDALYASLQKTFDEAEQIKIYHKMQVIYAEHQPVIHLFSPQLYVAASNRLGNLKPTVLRPYLTHNIQELYFKK